MLVWSMKEKDLPFLDCSIESVELDEGEPTCIVDMGPAASKEDIEILGVEDATGLAAPVVDKSFLLWLQSLFISRLLPRSGLQGRVAT